ncbi:hypothetical protein [Mixta gaviniae]|uniref:Uncharacterized protein n=1 Tax=Mixta gaviniae TaxID=665914 RepID=A0A2L0IGB4_9GAMM|nr:hypothetical protein [Mixta gaviniae]AUX93626.1 hypothetical protein C2E15_11395 [Mixta gaviniae]
MKATCILAIVAALAASAPLVCLADAQCGPFHIGALPAKNGGTTINGVKPLSQKVTFLQQKGDYDNVKIKWIVPATKFQGNYSMNYLNKSGTATLEVEVVRTSRSQIRIHGLYDCEKIG